MGIAIPRHPSFLSVVTERKQRARLKGETNVFSLENPTSFIGNCFRFHGFELFCCDMGRNRVCSISIPLNLFNIIDLRAAARTVDFLRFWNCFHYGFRRCKFHSAFCILHSAFSSRYRADGRFFYVFGIVSITGFVGANFILHSAFCILHFPRATARTVDFLRLGIVSITGFVGANFILHSAFCILHFPRATARTVGFLRFGDCFRYGFRGCKFHSAFCILHSALKKHPQMRVQE